MCYSLSTVTTCGTTLNSTLNPVQKIFMQFVTKDKPKFPWKNKSSLQRESSQQIKSYEQRLSLFIYELKKRVNMFCDFYILFWLNNYSSHIIPRIYLNIFSMPLLIVCFVLHIAVKLPCYLRKNMFATNFRNKKAG